METPQDEVKCTGCGHPNPATARFCRQCGLQRERPVEHLKLSSLPRRKPKGPSPLLWLLLIPIGFGIWWTFFRSEERPGRYQIRVSTSPPSRFTGTYRGRLPGGDTQKSVQGIGTGFYDAGDSPPSAVFQRSEGQGTLRLEIWRDGAKQKAKSSTAPRERVSLTAE